MVSNVKLCSVKSSEDLAKINFHGWGWVAGWVAGDIKKTADHPMVNSKGKLQGKGPPKRVRIVWTAGWVEPGDKWMMVTIHLSAALNPLMGPHA